MSNLKKQTAYKINAIRSIGGLTDSLRSELAYLIEIFKTLD